MGINERHRKRQQRESRVESLVTLCLHLIPYLAELQDSTLLVSLYTTVFGGRWVSRCEVQTQMKIRKCSSLWICVLGPESTGLMKADED
ncbi:hypothetical protein K2173_016207 [Erythroxylum novogranatense]|uniref:Uncharacterized protein n=1 Tax=Erythroxylum novogranatense TaxID=1862640 RepID=A0AAV8SFK3_9ROSI|nr:hypothetical protein K2173_016207 [Erythroxylum novogranatense]